MTMPTPRQIHEAEYRRQRTLDRAREDLERLIARYGDTCAEALVLMLRSEADDLEWCLRCAECDEGEIPALTTQTVTRWGGPRA